MISAPMARTAPILPHLDRKSSISRIGERDASVVGAQPFGTGREEAVQEHDGSFACGQRNAHDPTPSTRARRREALRRQWQAFLGPFPRRVPLRPEVLATEELPDHTLTVRYRFVHVLYQNVLYGSLSVSRRVQLSKAIGETILKFQKDVPGGFAAELGFQRFFVKKTSRFSLLGVSLMSVGILSDPGENGTGSSPARTGFASPRHVSGGVDPPCAGRMSS
jgi:hypothetical protein